MSSNQSKVKLSFHPLNEGADLITLNTFNNNSNFHCDEITAEFSDKDIEIFLSGFFDSGARIKGRIKNETISLVSVLKFIQSELKKNNQKKQEASIVKAQSILNKELKNLIKTVKQSQDAIKDILRIEAEDFEWSREVVSKSLHNYFKRKKKSLSYELPYSSVSSFLLINLEDENNDQGNDIVSSTLKERCKIIDNSLVLVSDNDRAFFEFSSELVSSGDVKDLTGFFRLKHQSSEWIDYEAELTINQNKARFSLDVTSFTPGTYAVTSYLKSYYTNECIWYNSLGQDMLCSLEARREPNSKRSKSTIKIVAPNYVSYESFSKWCMKNVHKSGFGKYFYDNLKAASAEHRENISQYYLQAIKNCSRKITKSASSVIKAFRILGVSEVLMLTPEGPHAMAGGLSQVITGLSAALANEECAVTIISPLYFEKNGNHHDSLEKVLTEGIDFNGVRVIPEKLGVVYIPDNFHGQVSKLRSAIVYKVQHQKMRLLLIANKELCDRLYGGVSGSDRLRRSSFFSRVAVEIIKDPAFSCSPDIIMTNDWTTAIFPHFIKSESAEIKKIPIIHMLHNVGVAYQGRFNLVENNEDIFAALSLPESLKEVFLEKNNTVINFTKAGCEANLDAVVTVSRPYAQQIIRKEEFSEISEILRSKIDRLFGISNGIPTNVVQSAAFGGLKELDSSNISYQEIVEMKSLVRKEIQDEYGLSLSKSNQDILAVLVGRLTDQKGLSLLTEAFDSDKSVLERILEDCPKAHIIIAGPPADSDFAFKALENLILNKLSNHPRFRHRFEFLPHSSAIKLTAAADIFLMPSKYEPGGIAQLEALAVGTTVVAHRIGGLSATLQQYQRQTKTFSGNSFLFEEFDKRKFYQAFLDAYQAMSSEIDKSNIITSSFNAKNDWKDRVSYYLCLFQKIIGLFDDQDLLNSKISENRRELLSKVSAKQ